MFRFYRRYYCILSARFKNEFLALDDRRPVEVVRITLVQGLVEVFVPQALGRCSGIERNCLVQPEWHKRRSVFFRRIAFWYQTPVDKYIRYVFLASVTRGMLPTTILKLIISIYQRLTITVIISISLQCFKINWSKYLYDMSSVVNTNDKVDEAVNSSASPNKNMYHL